MNRCKTCLIPDTRPDTAFIDGECSACVSFRKRIGIDWDARRKDLIRLLDQHHGECIVPSSGGKDSTWQVLKLLELGAHVTVVTATTCMLTEIGRKNIDNLARYAKTIEVTPNRAVRAKLNRIGLQMVGDISWPEHVSIFTTPFNVACDTKIPLIIYGENPQEAYGGPQGADQARQMTRRWVSEFGGFLGLRPSDLVGVNGITKRDMQDYMPPSDADMQAAGVEAHWLGQYFEWDSHRNAEEAIKAGMIAECPSPANFWIAENLDNAMTGLHCHGMYRKYGYGRLAAQISVDIRAGRIERNDALDIARQRDGLFPDTYAGFSFSNICEHIGMSSDDVMKSINTFTNFDLFCRVENRRPILKEFA